MEDSLKEVLYNEVSSESDRKRREIDYIFGVMRNSEYNSKLIELFGQNENEEFPKSHLERRVFD